MPPRLGSYAPADHEIAELARSLRVRLTRYLVDLGLALPLDQHCHRAASTW